MNITDVYFGWYMDERQQWMRNDELGTNIGEKAFTGKDFGWHWDELRWIEMNWDELVTNMGHWRAARACAGVTRAHHLRIIVASHWYWWLGPSLGGNSGIYENTMLSRISSSNLRFQINPCRAHTQGHRLYSSLQSEADIALKQYILWSAFLYIKVSIHLSHNQSYFSFIVLFIVTYHLACVRINSTSGWPDHWWNI